MAIQQQAVMLQQQLKNKRNHVEMRARLVQYFDISFNHCNSWTLFVARSCTDKPTEHYPCG